MTIRLLSAIAAVLTLAACGGSSASAPSGSPSPAPAVTSPSPTSAQVISQAWTAECSDFATVDSRMTADTASATTVGALVPVVTQNGRAWMRDLTRAMNDSDSAPEGRNAARNMSVRIARVNAAVGLLGLYAAIPAHNLSKINPLWSKIVRQMASIDGACNG